MENAIAEKHLSSEHGMNIQQVLRVLAVWKRFSHSFIQWNPVLHVGLQVDGKTGHIVLFADAEEAMDAELSLRASTRALSSFFFEFTTYFSFISHMHLHRTCRLGK